jgi:hypothetical protein
MLQRKGGELVMERVENGAFIRQMLGQRLQRSSSKTHRTSRHFTLDEFPLRASATHPKEGSTFTAAVRAHNPQLRA